jgi:hypothetical protein
MRLRTTGLLPLELPMTAKVTRESKGVYVCKLSFKFSKRHYDNVLIRAPNKRVAIQLVRERFSNVVKVK